MVECVNTSGKRKTAIARATVKEGSGRVTINKVPIEVFTPELARLKIEEPLGLVPEKAEKVDIAVTVNGMIIKTAVHVIQGHAGMELTVIMNVSLVDAYLYHGVMASEGIFLTDIVMTQSDPDAVVGTTYKSCFTLTLI